MDIEGSGGKFFIQDLNGELREVGDISSYATQDATALLSDGVDERIYWQSQPISFTLKMSKSAYKSISVLWDRGRRARRYRARMRRTGTLQNTATI